MKNEKSCGCIIIDNGKVLLVKQTAGHWGFPKGHVEANETEIETAIRETKEETNLSVEIVSNARYTMEYVIDEDIHKEVVYFIAKETTNNVIAQESEISDIKWFSFKEAFETISFDNAKALLKKVLSDLKLL